MNQPLFWKIQQTYSAFWRSVEAKPAASKLLKTVTTSVVPAAARMTLVPQSVLDLLETTPTAPVKRDVQAQIVKRPRYSDDTSWPRKRPTPCLSYGAKDIGSLSKLFGASVIFAATNYHPHFECTSIVTEIQNCGEPVRFDTKRSYLPGSSKQDGPVCGYLAIAAVFAYAQHLLKSDTTHIATELKSLAEKSQQSALVLSLNRQLSGDGPAPGGARWLTSSEILKAITQAVRSLSNAACYVVPRDLLFQNAYAEIQETLKSKTHARRNLFCVVNTDSYGQEGYHWFTVICSVFPPSNMEADA